jgi:ethanolamine ammonia-lyase large subunit
MLFRTKLFGKPYEFKDVKEVLAKANERKSGDEQAGIAAETVQERIAAKVVLSETPLWVLRAAPVVDYDKDEVTRAIDDGLDEAAYNKVKDMTVGEFKAWIFHANTSTDDIKAVSPGLTGEMSAAVAKLCSSIDLVTMGAKIPVVTHNTCTCGLPGRLSARLQPNDPTDDPDGIRAEIYEGMAYAMGDQVWGINPSIDTVENLMRLYDMMWDIKETWNVPAGTCNLGHVTTQMECLKKGAKVGQVFQSIAGTEDANKSFGVTVGMLDEAHELAKKYCYAEGPNVMYFETGEMIRAGLEDHLCGKLLGVPLGCDNCYTNHNPADQNAIELELILEAAAGVNYHMGVPLGDDVMLAYQCASYHDTAGAWHAMGLRPAPEYEEWAESMGIMKDGKLTDKAGDPSMFLKK